MANVMKYAQLKDENGQVLQIIPIGVDSSHVDVGNKTLDQVLSEQADLTDLAYEFVQSEVYKSGDYVVYNNGLYRLTADHAANVAWSSTSKVQVKLADQVSNLIKVSPTQPGGSSNKLWIDSDAEENIQLPTYEDFSDLVKVSNTQPISESNKIWIKQDETEVEIPTMEEFEGTVRHDIKQKISDAGKIRARENIEAASSETLDMLKDCLDELKIYSKKTIVNSRWPRVELSVLDGVTYYIRILKAIGPDDCEKIWVVQGSTNLTDDLKSRNQGGTFTPVGQEPVYLSFRYTTIPTDTPSIIYELREFDESDIFIRSSLMVINSNNKNAICKGDVDNIPENVVFGVSNGSGLLHAPFENSYFQILGLAERINGTTTSITQIAFDHLNNMAIRRNDSTSWTGWKNYGSDLDESKIYSVKTTPNLRWPRIQLSVLDGVSYYIRILKAIGPDDCERLWVVQGSADLSKNLKQDYQGVIFTPSGEDPVYLSFRYTTVPENPPTVIYELRRIWEKQN